MKEISYLFPVFFVGLFVFAIFIISRKGWSDLVSRYQFDGVFQGNRFGIISAGINGMNYNNCLVMKYNEQGFYLRPVFVFRLFHKGIFIPWTEISEIRDKKILFVQLKELVIGRPVVAIMQINKSTYLKIEETTLIGQFGMGGHTAKNPNI